MKTKYHWFFVVCFTVCSCNSKPLLKASDNNIQEFRQIFEYIVKFNLASNFQSYKYIQLKSEIKDSSIIKKIKKNKIDDIYIVPKNDNNNEYKENAIEFIHWSNQYYLNQHKEKIIFIFSKTNFPEKTLVSDNELYKKVMVTDSCIVYYYRNYK